VAVEPVPRRYPFWQQRLVVAGVALISLVLSTQLHPPRLYIPLFICGVAVCGLLVLTLAALFRRRFAERASGGLAITLALGALLLHALLFQLWDLPAPEGPVPVELGPIFLAQLEACCAVSAVFLAIRARQELAAALLGMVLALLVLFLIGRHGTGDYPGKAAALTSSVVATVVLGYGLVDWMVRRARGGYGSVQRK
jgi:drug/metabolite transporter (DMT)-like permease